MQVRDLRAAERKMQVQLEGEEMVPIMPDRIPSTCSRADNSSEQELRDLRFADDPSLEEREEAVQDVHQSQMQIKRELGQT